MENEYSILLRKYNEISKQQKDILKIIMIFYLNLSQNAKTQTNNDNIKDLTINVNNVEYEINQLMITNINLRHLLLKILNLNEKTFYKIIKNEFILLQNVKIQYTNTFFKTNNEVDNDVDYRSIYNIYKIFYQVYNILNIFELFIVIYND